MIYVIISFAGLFLTLIAVFGVQKLAHRLGAISVPGGRSIHRDPTPLLGGLAVYVAFFSITLLSLFFAPKAYSNSLWGSGWKLLGLFCGATCILIVGIIDDIRPMRARTKLLFQVISALICVAFGFTIESISLPAIQNIQFGSFGAIVFLVWVIGIVNAVNLIDGMDGLASTVCFFASLGNGLMALQLNNVFIAFFSFLLAGSLIGFLFHNFPPAKIFLGDTGSMLLGFLLSVIVIESNMQKRDTAVFILAPLLLLAFSLLDVFLSIIRRFLRGKPIMSSDLGHIHHRLMSRFRNPRRVLMIVGAFSCFTMLTSVAMRLYHQHNYIVWGLLTLSFFVLLAFAFVLGYFRVDRLISMLNDREEVKFFFFLIAHMNRTLPKLHSAEEMLFELDWICRALKPHELTFYHEEGVLYHHKNASDCMTELHTEELSYNQKLLVRWRIETSHENPENCDIRLAWRELIILFRKAYLRLQEERSLHEKEEIRPDTGAYTQSGPGHSSSSYPSV